MRSSVVIRTALTKKGAALPEKMDVYPVLLLGEDSAVNHASPLGQNGAVKRLLGAVLTKNAVHDACPLLGQNGRAWARLPAFPDIRELDGWAYEQIPYGHRHLSRTQFVSL